MKNKLDRLYNEWKIAADPARSTLRDTLYLELLKNGERIIGSRFSTYMPDVVADVSADVILNLEAFTGRDPRSGKSALFSRYFYSSIVNAAIDEFRRARNESRLGNEYHAALDSQREGAVEAKALVDGWLTGTVLTDKEKKLMRYRLDNTPWSEVAKALNTTESAIWKRWQRLKEKLVN